MSRSTPSKRKHVRHRSSYSNIKVPALPEEDLSEIKENTKPRTVWTDIEEFHKKWKALSAPELHDALLIIPGLEIEWILEPDEYRNEHNLPALFDLKFAVLLQWKHIAGHLHCALNNGLFWWNLNKQLTINLPDPSTFYTTNYKPLILNETYYRSKGFRPQCGTNKEDIFSMLRGEFVKPSIARIVIKEVILQSISSLHFMENCRSLTAISPPPTPQILKHSLSISYMTSDEDLSDDEFVESLLSDGLSDGFPDTFPFDEHEQPRIRRTFSSLSLLSLPSTSWLFPIPEGHETSALTPSPPTKSVGGNSECKESSDTEDMMNSPDSFAGIGDMIDQVLATCYSVPTSTRSLSSASQSRPRRQSDVSSSSVSSSTPWPMARTASQEAKDQRRFCVMNGSMLHDAEIYYDASSDFMRTADEKTRAFPLLDEK